MDTKQMNELLVIGSSCLRTRGEMCGERLFRRSTEKTILGRDYRFFAILLSVIILVWVMLIK